MALLQNINTNATKTVSFSKGIYYTANSINS